MSFRFASIELISHLTSFFPILLDAAPALSAVNHRMATELLGVLKTNYIVWPLSSYIIFRRVPEALRVVVSSIVALFWNAYLCWRIA